jgi:hypothetical protein
VTVDLGADLHKRCWPLLPATAYSRRGNSYSAGWGSSPSRRTTSDLALFLTACSPRRTYSWSGYEWVDGAGVCLFGSCLTLSFRFLGDRLWTRFR